MRCLGNHLVPPGGGPPLMVFTREFVFLFDFFSSSAFTWAGDRPRRGIPSRRPPSWRWWAVLRARRTSSCRASPSPRPFRDPRDRPVAASPAPPCGSGPRSRNCSKKKMGTMLAVRTFRQVLVSFEQKKTKQRKNVSESQHERSITGHRLELVAAVVVFDAGRLDDGHRPRHLLQRHRRLSLRSHGRRRRQRHQRRQNQHLRNRFRWPTLNQPLLSHFRPKSSIQAKPT